MKQMMRLQLFSLVLLSSLFTILSANAQTHTPRYVSMCSKTRAYYEYLPEGYNPSGTTTYPVILFMPGIGEYTSSSTDTALSQVLKNGIPKLIKAGTFPKSFTSGGLTHRFIVITPLFSSTSKPVATDMNMILDYIVSHYKANTKRIYITGLSYGAGLTFSYPGYSTAYASRVAAIVPTATPLPDGGNQTIYTRSRNIAAGNVPVWATHNKGDRQPDSSTNTISYVNYINQAPAPNPMAKMTLFNVNGHDSWTKTYDPNFRENGYNIYEWMLLHEKGSAPPAPNAVPVAKAGSDKTVTLPAYSVTLSGSGTDSDGSIVAYNWTKVSGPSQGTLSSPTKASTTVTSLAAGTYTFRLTVSDNKSAKATDDVKVYVKAAPGKLVQVNIYGGTNPYKNTAWNNWNIASSRTVTSLKYSDATTSAVGAVLSASGGLSDNGSTYGGTMAPPEVLRYRSYYGGTRTLTIKGLSTSKKYNLELYASSANTGNSTKFTIGATSITILTDYNKTNKAAFTNLVPNSSGQIVVTIAKVNTNNYLNGFILTELTSTTTTTTVKATSMETTAPMLTASQLPQAGAAAISVFPNPVENNVLLSLSNPYNGIVQVQVTDAAGKVRKAFRFTKGGAQLQQSLPVSDLPGGVYFIVVQQGTQKQVTTISKR